MTLHKIPEILEQINLNTGGDTVLPFHLQVGSAMLGVSEHYGLPHSNVDEMVFQRLRQAQIRAEGKNEDDLTQVERQALKPKSIEDYRQRFEENVEYVMQKLTPDGLIRKVDIEQGVILVFNSRAIAEQLAGENPFIVDAHVREAQTRIKADRKRALAA